MLEYQKNKKALVLAAHPDDEVLGCGATLSKLSSKGYSIEVITFTDGVTARGEGLESRSKKLSIAGQILGATSFTQGDFPDNRMDSVPMLDVVKFIESNTAGHYDLIFTHFPQDLNVDHQRVAYATITAFRPQFGRKSKIYSYYVPSATDYNCFSTFDGSSYFEVSQHDVHLKIEALKVYGDEMREYPHSRSYDNVKNIMKSWGAEVGVEYAEKFKLVREVV